MEQPTVCQVTQVEGIRMLSGSSWQLPQHAARDSSNMCHKMRVLNAASDSLTDSARDAVCSTN